MNNEEIQAVWNEQKVKLRKRFSVLTDKDLMFKEGKKEEMIGKLRKKLGKSKDEFQHIMKYL